ncbi:hypothetical protein AvCA_45670 [Azotobacter vinelandii CA]|uniref:Uncharacterized protein n=2 Tax=Azotobacter vinelandii TaxID=354 RepID=C1DHU6_AZOVD|nr:hypothetical protein [Azotobacter vinelandii]ACO80679.1 hypothetical protein Avin_45670 [Azotobacter vinelandii DJ]AGK15909.1 hypothetical protein AvCA_45670 [Azotobacter vinelandii CA]AGK22086.1 hypothetical protein AvCA6_45670 [Azotobacter vinelandii CA6]WKN21433.1 hypothetical protein AVAEIV_004521 [Azotobacter vinelandii]SFY04369.1 hypothetical protein SAMN04244547_03733 [Azotobacter vinelandii]
MKPFTLVVVLASVLAIRAVAGDRLSPGCEAPPEGAPAQASYGTGGEPRWADSTADEPSDPLFKAIHSVGGRDFPAWSQDHRLLDGSHAGPVEGIVAGRSAFFF